MRIERTLKQLAEDPFHPTLHSHKLKGELAGAWACTVDYDNRVLFEFVRNPESGEEEILLLTIGTHDEVY
jgi:mRNA-degrading endonuclease YafQ of YafQ-DinJ toxin-antitoxin module